MPTAVKSRSLTGETPAEGRVVDDLLRQVLRGVEDPLEGLPQPLERLHRGKRILLVDDFKPTLERIKRGVEEFYPSESDNIVEAVSDPTLAERRIIEAARAGRPYDVLVFDMSMTDYSGEQPRGFNGDELLRRIAVAGALSPVVYNSGSWANDMKTNLHHQLDEVRTAKTLAATVGSIRTELHGVPVFFVDKYAGEHSTRNLALAMDAAMLVGEQADLRGFQAYARDFKPEVVEANYSTECLSKMAEIARLTRDRLREFVEEGVERFPEFAQRGGFRALEQLLSRPSAWSRTSYAAFSNPESGRSNIHLFEGTLMELTQSTFVNAEKRDYQDPDMARIGNDDELVNYVRRAHYDFNEYFAQLRAYNEAYKAPRIRRFGLEKIVEVLPDSIGFFSGVEKVRVLPADEVIPVETEDMLMYRLAGQPVMNGMKAIRGKEDGFVEISAQTVKVGDLANRPKEYFHGLGLMDADSVGAIVVRDNGVGIPSENMGRVFDDGFSTFGTSGWGLDFLRKNIGRLKGAYHVESKVGEGTTFYMYFKLAEEQDASGNG